jgi:hypothetical protein
VFDINETTLDIEYTAPVFERVFGNKAVLREWFAQLILYSNAISLAGPYATFFELGQGLLEMLADIHRVSVKPSDVEELRHPACPSRRRARADPAEGGWVPPRRLHQLATGAPQPSRERWPRQVFRARIQH